MSMDVSKIQSLLRQSQLSQHQTGESTSSQAFADLLKDVSDRSKAAGDAAEAFITTGAGELHQVQLQLAKADLSFRFLVEIRNKLTEAYQEIARLPM